MVFIFVKFFATKKLPKVPSTKNEFPYNFFKLNAAILAIIEFVTDI